MTLDRMTDSQLADVAANIVTLLGGTELDAIDTNVRADLVTAFGTLPAQLASQTAEATVREGEKLAAFSIKRSIRDEVLELTRRTRDALKAGRAPKEQFDLCNLPYKADPVQVYEAQDPTEMSAWGYSNGVNKGRFRGNNKPGRVVYEIWRRVGDDGGWEKHQLTRRQSFDDIGVVPGQHYTYKVRAIAAQTVSNFSNNAVVYGVL